MTIGPDDDYPHQAEGAPWQEEWWFDFSAADASLGGFVRLAVQPGRAAFWAGLVGDDRPYLLVRDDDVAPPRGPSPEIRAEALWSTLECETPLEHWTVGLEAFAVELDDPFDAWRGERGARIGLGFDLEWEATGPVLADEVGFGQPCEVHGEVLVGRAEALDVALLGWRRRSWGPPRATPLLPETGDDREDPVRHVAPVETNGMRLQFELTARPRWRVRR